MLFKMIRTQTGDCGTLHAGVIYDASKDAKLAKEAKLYIDLGFAESVTKKELAALVAAAESAEPEAKADEPEVANGAEPEAGAAASE